MDKYTTTQIKDNVYFMVKVIKKEVSKFRQDLEEAMIHGTLKPKEVDHVLTLLKDINCNLQEATNKYDRISKYLKKKY